MFRFRFTIFLLLALILFLFPIPCASEELPPEEEPVASGWGLYFGLLHSHTAQSGGLGTPEEAFRSASEVEGLDFFALTDYSDSFDNSLSASIGEDAGLISTRWADGKAAAAAVTGPDFVGLYGYEMNWGNGLGHITTFGTPGFQSWQQEPYRLFRSGLQNYYDTLTTIEHSISMFNHPGSFYGHFQNFSFYQADYDDRLTLLEVGSGSGIDCKFYNTALDKGWHVAPTCNLAEFEGNWGLGKGRTVVYAHSRTEEGILDALEHCRAYATQDNDLSIYYSMDGHFMGSRLKTWAVGETADILVTLSDPTDPVGLVEVIADGQTIASETLDSSWGNLTFSVSPEYRYYYLRITQADGDVAVTAPIWLEGQEQAGISSFRCDTALPVQNQPVTLSLELYNREYTPLEIQSVELSANGEPLLSFSGDFSLNWGETRTVPISFTSQALGRTDLTVTVHANLNGAPRVYSQALTLSFYKSELVTDLLIDGTHGNTKSYPQLAALAVKNQVSVTLETTEITAEMLEKSSILVIPPGEIPFEDSFLTLVKNFVDYGGCLILGGSEENNRLLEFLGSSIRFGPEDGEIRYLSDFSPASPWCANLQPGQLYRCSGSLEAGSGHWIVEGALAVEGRIFAGSGQWFSDESLADPKNIWDPPSANRTILSNILGDTQVQLPLTAIADLRGQAPGQVVRLRGYATSGTVNPHNTFPDTLYLQDDTGGIAVTPFTEPGISVGTPLEITGTLEQAEKNLVLHPISWEVLEAAPHRYLPLEGDWNQLMNNALHGGDLVQVEGKVVSFVFSGESGISELILEDRNGNFATVSIEDTIFSGATGQNLLAENVRSGRTFRAIGIVSMRADGVSVLRVRNCDEVVYVPPLNYVWEPRKGDNPPVGDGIGCWMIALIFSAVAIPILCKRRVM